MEDGEEQGSSNTINILDAFAGVGGNLIQFAKKGYCVGVDNDPVKVEYTRNNAKVYGLSELKDFQVVERDFLHLESYHEIAMMDDEGQQGEPKCIRFPATS